MIPTSVLERFLDRGQQINQAEAFAGVIAMATLGELVKGEDLFHFVDNTMALGGFIGGTSSQSDSSTIFTVFHAYVVELEVRYWAEHVESSANLADGPSRQGLSDPVVAEFRCEVLPTFIPEFARMAKDPEILMGTFFQNK